jgi:hypothetical protein
MIVEMEQNPLKAAVQLSLGGLAVDEDIDIDESAVDLLGLPETAARRENLSNAGRGRPRGARNHTTQYWVDYIRRRYCSPLEVLAQLATSPIDVLAREASCSRLDAIIQKRHAAELPTCYADPGAPWGGRRCRAFALTPLLPAVTPNLVGPCVRLGLADDPSVEQIGPALLIVLAQLVRPIGDDDAPTSLEKGGLRSERTDGEVTDTTKRLRGIGGSRHDGSVKERDIGSLVRDRPGEAWSTVCPIDRQQVMRPQLDFSASTPIKNGSSIDKPITRKSSPVWEIMLDPL